MSAEASVETTPIILEGQTAAELSEMAAEFGMTAEQFIVDSIAMHTELQRYRAAGFSVILFRHHRRGPNELLELKDLRAT